jgi:hypothetical protein
LVAFLAAVSQLELLDDWEGGRTARGLQLTAGRFIGMGEREREREGERKREREREKRAREREVGVEWKDEGGNQKRRNINLCVYHGSLCCML